MRTEEYFKFTFDEWKALELVKTIVRQTVDKSKLLEYQVRSKNWNPSSIWKLEPKLHLKIGTQFLFKNWKTHFSLFVSILLSTKSTDFFLYLPPLKQRLTIKSRRTWAKLKRAGCYPIRDPTVKFSFTFDELEQTAEIFGNERYQQGAVVWICSKCDEACCTKRISFLRRCQHLLEF